MSIRVILKSSKKNWEANKFDSLLTGKKISDKEYEHKFEIKTVKDYHDLY